ncbi:MAG: glycoside hydrolase family 10 protein [Thermoguttaceae bacterium]
MPSFFFRFLTLFILIISGMWALNFPDVLAEQPKLAKSKMLEMADSDSTRSILNLGKIIDASPNTSSQELLLPFAAELTRDRSTIDFELCKNLADFDEFVLELDAPRPEAVGHITLYFRSGAGWYGCSGSTSKRGKQAISFSRGNFRAEGNPAGFDNIDAVRVAFWRGTGVDASVKVEQLSAISFSTCVIVGDESSPSTNTPQFAHQMFKILEGTGITAAQMPHEIISEQSILNRKVILLPLNPQLSAPALSILNKFVQKQGKIIAFYQISKELAKSLGFINPQYVRSPDGDAAFAEIRFEPDMKEKYFNSMLPDRIVQHSWNITTMQPDPKRPDAKIAAWWYDKAGKKTEYPAILVSDSGLFFSHILTNEDIVSKQRFLLALLGKYDENVWPNVVRKQVEKMAQIGTLPNDELPFVMRNESLKNRYINEFAPLLQKSPDSHSWPNLYLQATNFLHEISESYIESLPSQSGEFRAWWEHAGTGAYPGDWDRTMNELAANGFTAVIPNMLWGGLAHYKSDVLPTSSQYEKYGDQIEQAVRAGKKYGIEVHVWKVNYNASNAPKEFLEQMKKEGRLQKKQDGEETPWLCPSHPKNQKLECDAMVEIAKNYDVTGIHFDYIRYPGDDSCFCDGCKERFGKHLAEKGFAPIQNFVQECTRGKLRNQFDSWRCDQISKLVERVYKEAKQVKPSIKISAAVFPQFPSCKNWVLQDWVLWCESGWLDFLCPMNYTDSPMQFAGYVESQQKLTNKKIPIYPGIGATATGLGLSPEEVAMQIEIARKSGATGFTIFNLDQNTMNVIPPALVKGPTKPPASKR